MSWSIEVIIPAAVISTLITVTGNLIANLMTRKTAKVTAQEAANQEIRKQEHAWTREDILTSDDEYGEMVKLVVMFTAGTVVGPYEALAAIAALRIKEAGDIANVLDLLYHAVKQRDRTQADQALDSLIYARRMLKDQA